MLSVNGSDCEDTQVDHESVGAQFAHLLSERTRENLRKRHAIRAAAHQQLQAEGFGEFDTPVLGRWVNEYRVGNISATTSTGEHLWLAQSPQVYKQMLIAGGTSGTTSSPTASGRRCASRERTILCASSSSWTSRWRRAIWRP